MPSFFSFFNKEPESLKTTPFTTQARVLSKFGVGESESSVNHKIIGMCDPMSNEYALESIRGENPTEILQDDLTFLNRSIMLENTQNGLEKKGASDTNHIAFTSSGIPHKEVSFTPGNLSEQINGALSESDHMLMTFPSDDKYRHQVYFGRDTNKPTTCRFFDANLSGGERKGSCPELVAQFSKFINSAYPLTNTSNIEVGMSIG